MEGIKQKNKKISEFDKVELNDTENLSYILVPLSVYDYEKNSYVNAAVDVDDIIKFSYSYTMDKVYSNLISFWETYDENDNILSLN